MCIVFLIEFLGILDLAVIQVLHFFLEDVFFLNFIYYSFTILLYFIKMHEYWECCYDNTTHVKVLLELEVGIA